MLLHINENFHKNVYVYAHLSLLRVDWNFNMYDNNCEILCREIFRPELKRMKAGDFFLQCHHPDDLTDS